MNSNRFIAEFWRGVIQVSRQVVTSNALFANVTGPLVTPIAISDRPFSAVYE